MVYPIRLPFTLANFAVAVCQRGDKMSVFFMRTFCTKISAVGPILKEQAYDPFDVIKRSVRMMKSVDRHLAAYGSEMDFGVEYRPDGMARAAD